MELSPEHASSDPAKPPVPVRRHAGSDPAPLPGAPPAASTRLDLHRLGLDDVHLVLVAAPDTVVHDGHAADGVVRVAQVQQVVVAQVPLAVCREPETPPQARPGPTSAHARGGCSPARSPGGALPSPRWKMARVPSARATSTRPFTCLERESGERAEAGPPQAPPDAPASAGGHVHQAQDGVLQLDGVQTLLPIGHS